MTQIRVVGATVLVGAGAPAAELEVAYSSESGLLTFVGPTRGPARPVDIDGRGRLVMPGLVNGHTHAGMAMLRGYADDLPFTDWLARIRAFEDRLTMADLVASLRLALVEMVRGGTVGFVDMFAWTPDLLAEVVSSGLRVAAGPAVFGYDAVSYPGALQADGRGLLDGVPALAAEFAGEQRVTVGYAVHAPYTCGADLLADVADRARRKGLPVQIHLSETRREVEESLARHGRSPIRLAADQGLFDGPLHVAHAVHPVAGDVELLARPGVSVSHNPVSNLKLGAGIAPLSEYLAAGVRLALGTDSVASNNTLDLFEEVKTAILAQRGGSQDVTAIGAATVLAMATTGGASVLQQGLSGRLEVGAPADFALLDLNTVEATPLTDLYSFLAYSAGGHLVTDVVIAGRPVVRDRRCLTIDEDAARAEVRERSARIRAEIVAG